MVRDTGTFAGPRGRGADNLTDSVLIGQLSVAAGAGEQPRVEGQLDLRGVNDGTFNRSSVS